MYSIYFKITEEKDPLFVYKGSILLNCSNKCHLLARKNHILLYTLTNLILSVFNFYVHKISRIVVKGPDRIPC